jgi:hypothetical protein
MAKDSSSMSPGQRPASLALDIFVLTREGLTCVVDGPLDLVFFSSQS